MIRSPLMRRVGILAAACAFAVPSACQPDSGTPDGAPPPVRASVRPATVKVDELIREYRPTLDDELQLYGLADLEVVDGLLYIVERGNHRITVTDSLLDLVRRFGRQGEGPGELEMPWGVERLPSGRLAVTEIGNQRISVFTTDGEFVRTVPRATPHDAPGALNDTTYLVTGPGGDFGAGIVYGPGGVGHPFGPTGHPERDLMDIISDGSTRVWVGQQNLVALVRAHDGVIQVYDETGYLHRMDTIPEGIRSRLIARDRGIVDSFESQGLRVLGSSVVKQLSATSFGELLILLPIPDPFALVYSPADGSFSELHATEAPRERRILQSASSGYLDDGLLYLAQDEGIAVFRVPER